MQSLNVNVLRVRLRCQNRRHDCHHQSCLRQSLRLGYRYSWKNFGWMNSLYSYGWAHIHREWKSQKYHAECFGWYSQYVRLAE